MIGNVQRIKFPVVESDNLNVVIFKRANMWSNEVFNKSDGKSMPAISGTYGDRFIPRRYPKKEFFAIDTKRNVDITESKKDPSYWRQHNFKSTLQETLCGDIQNRLFYFFNASAKEDWHPKLEYRRRSLDWLCFPRSKPMAFAHTTHDLPGFRNSENMKIIGWASNGRIVASFGKELVMWIPNSANMVVYNIDNVRTLAFNPTGEYLAAGSFIKDQAVLEIWDMTTVTVSLKQSFVLHPTNDEIRSIAWDKTGKYIVCGTLSGEVAFSHIHRCKTILSTEKIHSCCITDIRFSCNYKYLAISDIKGKIVIWHWESLKVYFVFEPTSKQRVHIDWHPWADAELAIAQSTPASIAILHVASKEIVSCYRRVDVKCEIDAISFSKISGELVVSMTIYDADYSTKNEILVLASMDRVVDLLIRHEGAVHYLMWSPDGKFLASAGEDESLTLWNFFGHSEKAMRKCSNGKLKKKNVKKQAFPGYVIR